MHTCACGRKDKARGMDLNKLNILCQKGKKMNWKKWMLGVGCAFLTLIGAGQLAMAEAGSESAAVTEDSSEVGEGTLNILLIGSDRRDEGWYGNSDTMILLTVNDDMNQISMVSFMRDLAADIPGYGTKKLNAANALGGPELLMDTLTSNFGVRVDHYVAVDFQNIVNIIDALGGVDIEQTAEEVEVTNGYINSLCEDWGLDPEEYFITVETTHLNGLQALAYMRDRYVGNDYERTARQRKVLETLFSNVNVDSLGGLFKLSSTLMKNVETDIGLTDMFSLLGYVEDFSDYTLLTDRVPFDDLHTSSGEMLVPTQPDTNERLLTEIYGEMERVTE